MSATPFRVGISPDVLDTRGGTIFDPAALDLLGAPGIEWQYLTAPEEKVIAPETAAAYDAVCLMLGRVTRETFARGAGRLKIVARFGVGFDTIDVPACTENGVLLTIAPDGVRRPVAVNVITFVLVLAQRLLAKELAAGYDGLTAGALILLGAGIGVIGSTVNPFATGIASGFAGTTISEGLVGRLVILVVGTILGIVFVMRYAERVKKDPSKSLIFDMKAENEKQFMSGGGENTDFGKFTGRHKVILVLFFLAFVVMVYGVIPWADLGHPIPTWWWWFPEMTACFLFFGILIGIIGKLSEKDLVNTFVDGARDKPFELSVAPDSRDGATSCCPIPCLIEST